MIRLRHWAVAAQMLALILTVAACSGQNPEAKSPAEEPTFQARFSIFISL